jgi:hypothetical protein
MARKQRGNDQLKEASDFLFYEIWMFNVLAKGILLGLIEKGPLQNAMLESFIIHLRVLIGFFYPNQAKNDEIIAYDFFESPDAWNNLRPKSNILENEKNRAHKEVAHLTYKRKIKSEEKQWNVLEIYREISNLIKIFYENINKDLLGSRWNDYKLIMD